VARTSLSNFRDPKGPAATELSAVRRAGSLLKSSGETCKAPIMLERVTHDLAAAITAIDAKQPVARNKRSGVSFTAGIGPHSEGETFALALNEMRRSSPDFYRELSSSIPYPSNPRQRCDALLVTTEGPLFIEGKLLRLKGDNGKPNDNMLMHIVSPYAQHRSALTDCTKLSISGFEGRKAIVIVGYDYPDLPLALAIKAFELLAAELVKLGKRNEATFSGLCHPVHSEGRAMAWQVD
jgi:hypothetical protein